MNDFTQRLDDPLQARFICEEDSVFDKTIIYPHSMKSVREDDIIEIEALGWRIYSGYYKVYKIRCDNNTQTEQFWLKWVGEEFPLG